MFVGYHAVFDVDFRDALRFASRHGFDYVQFDLNVPRFFLDRVSPRQAREIRTLADELGVRVSFHAPGDNISLFTDYPRIRRGILAQFRLILERANQMGARHLTIHPGFPPSFRKANEREDSFAREYREYYVATLTENLSRISEHSGQVSVCVENYGLFSLAMEALSALLPTPAGIFLCWDIARSQNHAEVEAFFTTNLGRVREVHLHDVDPGGRQHLTIGDGTVPIRRYLATLRLPHIATTIEVRPREAALESKRRLVDLMAESKPQRQPGESRYPLTCADAPIAAATAGLLVPLDPA